jgi:hypothetical protein
MKRGTYAAGAMFASLAAGPLFLASLALAAWATSAPSTYEMNVRLDGLIGLVAASFGVAAFGFMLSAVPNLVGAWFMHGLGIGNFAARLPIPWALAGAGAAGLPFIFLADPSSPTMTVSMAFALTGASCALVANRFATWT